MTQLDLFGPAHMRKLQAENEELKDTLTIARTEYRKLRDERDTLKAQNEQLKDRCVDTMAQCDQLRRDLDQARRERDQAQRWTKLWRDLAESTHTPYPPTGPAPTLAPTLRQLLRIAHPDKWSQGQPATALAHEITIVLNRLREEVTL
jgi:hypothetical protein